MYGLIIKPQAFLYDKPEGFDRTDEVLEGWAVEILEGGLKRSHVLTHYGYTGWIDNGDVRGLGAEVFLLRASNERIRVVSRRLADVLEGPSVEARILTSLPRGSFVEVLGEEGDTGFYRVRLADGTSGFTAQAALARRLDSDGLFLADDRRRFLKNQQVNLPETIFRQLVVENALSYVGSQYRWAGKSPFGMDCSGLTFMSYMLSGLLIYRDGALEKEWPLRPIDPALMAPGDLVFFEDYVGVYIGGMRYVHSIAGHRAYGVVISSMDPMSQEYRDHDAGQITMAGSFYHA